MATEMLLPGDPAPALVLDAWLQRGVYEEVRPAGGRLLTVVEFCAAWDPGSRAVLPRHDEWQAELAARGVRFLAVSEEEPEEVHAYLKQSKLQNVAVVLGKQPRQDYLAKDGELPIPFAVIVSHATDDRVVWLGPAVVAPGSWAQCYGFTADLEQVLPQVIADTFDVQEARRLEMVRRELYDLITDLQLQALEGQWQRVRTLSEQVHSRTWPASFTPARVDAYTNAAWFLVDARAPAEEQVAVGRELLARAAQLAGSADSVRLHVSARALFAIGDIAGAAEAERKALAAPQPRGQLLQLGWASQGSCELALVRYENALRGAPPYAGLEPSAAKRPPETLTAAQAREDLERLVEALALRHPAYEDTAWRLAGEGRSWEARNAEYAARVESRPEWTDADFVDLVRGYLSVIEDKHTSLSGLVWRGERAAPTWLCPTQDTVPFFAEARVPEVNGRPRLDGAEIVAVPVVNVRGSFGPDRPYLFPTLPKTAGAKEYLLGVLAEADAPPASVTVRVRVDAGERAVTLPLHRGRVAKEMKEGDSWWSLQRGPLPVLAVHSMDPEKVSDMPATAEELRPYPAVVVDLRPNQGGSDLFAERWCARFSDQQIDPGGWAYLRPGETNPLHRWNSFLGDYWITRITGKASAERPPHYSGRLFVLTDKGTASAGEGFRRIAGKLDGALVVGENTAGCAAYGNVSEHVHLPHSLLTVQFGCSKGDSSGITLRDGIGYFPDYWLDTEDPVGAIAEYLEGSGVRGQGSGTAGSRLTPQEAKK